MVNSHIDNPISHRHYKSLATHLMAKVEDNEIIGPGVWAELTFSEKAVLPVIVRHADVAGMAFPSEERVAKLSGLNDRKTVRQSTKRLEQRKLISTRKNITRKGHTQKMYNASNILEKGSGFTIQSLFIDSGTWASLSPTAKSLAVVIWYFSALRQDLNPNFESGDYRYDRWVPKDMMAKYLAERSVDYCDSERLVLIQFSNISERSYAPAVRNLTKHGFISPHPEKQDGWLVPLSPPDHKILIEEFNDKKIW